MKRDYSTHLRQFHEAKWDEEIILTSVYRASGVLP